MLSKRDVKKSYYVWFLGAQEARAARGIRPALAALHRLERRAHDLDPFKVTLQVSPKGLKIIQNVDGRVKGGRGRNHTVKHFLPADSVTEVVSRGDAVVCVLLLYNPVTRCPLHAHAYRCDSEQTARALAAQLRTVAGLGPEAEDDPNPEEDEPIPLEDSPDPIVPETHRTQETTRLAPEQEVAAERLAAELRARLAGRGEPLLLPPRDYDTGRMKVPAAVVPQKRSNAKGVLGSSAGSSGIGSDLAPSPERPHTSSEEDWTESTAYMLHEAYETSAAAAVRRARSPSPKKSSRNPVSADRPIIVSQRNERSQNHSVSPKDRFNVAKEKFMNLEREKHDEEVEKRAQMRRQLNNILSRGPKTPDELQMRSQPRWPSDEEDIVVERRTEMPRPVLREQRSYSREDRDARDPHRGSYGREEREVRDVREQRSYQRDERDVRDPRMEQRASREYRGKDYREAKDPFDMRELKNAVKPLRDSKEREEYRNYKEDSRGREERYAREDNRKDVKYLREYREVDDIRDVRDERRAPPRLEQRYVEYRGDRYFDRYPSNNNKHSDDEGVESEKQFEEIRYVPQAEFPRRQKDNSKMDKAPPQPKRDARIELLEERQRQIEQQQLLQQKQQQQQQPPRRIVESPQRSRPYQVASSKEWEVLRRSYAEADHQQQHQQLQMRHLPQDRPARRDPRARHSYAEPVSRTRVGMATVAPF